MKLLILLLIVVLAVMANDQDVGDDGNCKMFTDCTGNYTAFCQNISLVNAGGHLGIRADCQGGMQDDNSRQCSVLDLDLCYEFDGKDIKAKFL